MKSLLRESQKRFRSMFEMSTFAEQSVEQSAEQSAEQRAEQEGGAERPNPPPAVKKTRSVGGPA